jgi:hypothetical protein
MTGDCGKAAFPTPESQLKPNTSVFYGSVFRQQTYFLRLASTIYLVITSEII